MSVSVNVPYRTKPEAFDVVRYLSSSVSSELKAEVTVAVYRCVAEGITNALRHGDPSHVSVDVGFGAAGRIEVDVCDDGTGGAVVPGVGAFTLQC